MSMSRAEHILQHVNEIAPKKVKAVRNKRVTAIVKCPPFYKRVGTSCIQDTPDEARRISWRRRMAWRRKTRTSLGKLLTHRRQSLALRAHTFGVQHREVKPDEFLAIPKQVRALKKLLAQRASQKAFQQNQTLAQQTTTTTTTAMGASKGSKGKSLAGQVSIPTTTPISQGTSSAGKV